MPKKNIWHLAIWQNWCFGQFYHSKIENLTLILSQFSLITGFLRKREKIFYTYSETFKTVLLESFSFHYVVCGGRRQITSDLAMFALLS